MKSNTVWISAYLDWDLDLVLNNIVIYSIQTMVQSTVHYITLRIPNSILTYSTITQSMPHMSRKYYYCSSYYHHCIFSQIIYYSFFYYVLKLNYLNCIYKTKPQTQPFTVDFAVVKVEGQLTQSCRSYLATQLCMWDETEPFQQIGCGCCGDFGNFVRFFWDRDSSKSEVM